jgi:glycogen(starch) synthase
MTILMTSDCVGGVWTYTLDLIRALPQAHFVVATMGELPTEAQRASIALLPNATLQASPWKLEWMDDPWEDVERAGEWLLELDRQFSPDVVHLNGYTHAVLPFRAPKVVVAHSCVLSWWRAVKGEDAPAEWNCYRRNVAAGLEAADMVVSPTGALLRELSQIYGEFGQTRVVWNGSASSITPRSSTHPFILCAGRLWDEAKNVSLLNNIALQLSAPIHAAGEAGESHGTGNNLEMLGFLDAQSMSAQMQDAAIWAHPARYEPFGLAVLEAANRDCALVLSDIPTLRELWEGAAVLVAPDDEAGWTAALQRLLDKPDERDVWAAKAKARATQYSLERFAEGYQRVYLELIARN